MLDQFNRRISYLRISITDRCNLRCSYCIPCEDFVVLPQNEILRFNEIVEVVKQAVELGVYKVRITGGEPLVRRDVVRLVEMIAGIGGIRDFGMTTNGILLEKFALPLARAGLMRVNVSLDTVDKMKFSRLTSGGDINRVFRGIAAARDAGLEPVKINCVVSGSSSEPDAAAVKRFAADNGLEARFIHQMNLEDGEFSIVEGGEGGDCHRCNRLRLTANGKVRPCLFSDLSYDVRTLGARNALLSAVRHKPECGTSCNHNHFYNLGG